MNETSLFLVRSEDEISKLRYYASEAEFRNCNLAEDLMFLNSTFPLYVCFVGVLNEKLLSPLEVIEKLMLDKLTELNIRKHESIPTDYLFSFVTSLAGLDFL